MQTGMTLYINHTLEAVEFYQEAFGLSLGYNEKFPDGTYMHAELQKNGVNVFAQQSANLKIMRWFPPYMNLPKEGCRQRQVSDSSLIRKMK